ncbi:hypothetical protein RINTHH_20890 [Richelia intracellularis HH01]|jgi:hypothetical protein|uniref:Uncharacterized protein n=1 Tax=Richelia intracellularis HH01 TaxID=1165094 RepID=M1WTP2_9NOST|nr:hypothetical protein RINTHH_20890 [Richelia intracellularis HH01]
MVINIDHNLVMVGKPSNKNKNSKEGFVAKIKLGSKLTSMLI